jgi:hypothetical protein
VAGHEGGVGGRRVSAAAIGRVLGMGASGAGRARGAPLLLPPITTQPAQATLMADLMVYVCGVDMPALLPTVNKLMQTLDLLKYGTVN